MNQQELKGKWKQIKGEVKKQWGRLTDDDLTEVEGDYDKLVGKIQERHGESQQAAKEWIDRFEEPK